MSGGEESGCEGKAGGLIAPASSSVRAHMRYSAPAAGPALHSLDSGMSRVAASELGQPADSTAPLRPGAQHPTLNLLHPGIQHASIGREIESVVALRSWSNRGARGGSGIGPGDIAE